MGDFRALGLNAPEPLTASHDFSSFSSGKPSLDSWLADMALRNQTSNYTRTFVVCGDAMAVRGYYALCAGMILRKDVPRPLSPYGAPGEIPIALLARLAVDSSMQGRGVGKALLAHALKTAASAAQAVAFRALIVDAIDEDAAAFCRKLGFQPTKISPTKLILPMQDVIASMTATPPE